MGFNQISDFDCYASWVGHTPIRREDDLFEWQFTRGDLHVVGTKISRAKERKYGFVNFTKCSMD